MEIEPYFERIGYSGSREPTAATLRQLHRAHMLRVPFENLDIPLGQSIECSLPSFYDKIVRRRRGGFCYELNGLFGWLLELLGFSVVLLSARVFDGDQPGQEFDHMVLLIELQERWIADVGFGDSFLEPLRLETAAEELQQGSSYRFAGTDSGRRLERRRESAWAPEFVFAVTPRQLREFSAMCHWQQTSPESNFIRKSVCSMATPGGRTTLSNGRLIVTEAGQRTERSVADEAEYRALLSTHFGIDLGNGVDVGQLMLPGTAPNQ